jgi:hypothetical protein
VRQCLVCPCDLAVVDGLLPSKTCRGDLSRSGGLCGLVPASVALAHRAHATLVADDRMAIRAVFGEDGPKASRPMRLATAFDHDGDRYESNRDDDE